LDAAYALGTGEKLGTRTLTGKVTEIEKTGDGTGTCHISVIAFKSHTDIADGTVAVIGQAVDDHGDTAGGIAFIDDFFEDDISEFTDTFFDGAFNIGVGHIDSFGGSQSGTQCRVAVGVGTAVFGSDHDFFADAGEHFSFCFIGGFFFVFNVCPFTVTGHNTTPC
jgi:hypothetical protein